ncbi:hypothetical protein D9Q98_010431 [Chlorella vulgaris]|uniref:Ribosome biogenesis regulatory protein n=1 Tax=Chlorella vulgaris TaxID=3077 RepID=A0A9D4TS66_CHLVU|nr:hypothetical protein D9Q98_010431 [Chlorella vulgaris]
MLQRPHALRSLPPLPPPHRMEVHDGPLAFDLGNLLAWDASAVDAAALTANGTDPFCQRLAQSIFQSLTARLFSLPSRRWRWHEWRRRYGYKRVNDETEVAVIQAKAGDLPGEDPFTKQRQDKKERAKKQQKQQLANLKAAVKAGGMAALPPTLRLAAALPEHGKGRPAKRKELHDELKSATKQAAVSTASMGKFDRIARGEKPAAPASAAAVQAVLSRLWRANCHKEPFCRLVCDTIPTATRLHMDQLCQCGDAPEDHHHQLWAWPVDRGKPAAWYLSPPHSLPPMSG